MVGHTHELVDGEHTHIRAFMTGEGLGRKGVGAVVATPGQFEKAMLAEKTWGVWNGHGKRCHAAENMDFLWDFESIFEDKTVLCDERDKTKHKHGQFFIRWMHNGNLFKNQEVGVCFVQF